MSILVCYASAHGATKEIAERIAATITPLVAPLAVECKPCANVSSLRPTKTGDPNIDKDYRAVVVGSAIQGGRWIGSGGSFIMRNSNYISGREFHAVVKDSTGVDVDVGKRGWLRKNTRKEKVKKEGEQPQTDGPGAGEGEQSAPARLPPAAEQPAQKPKGPPAPLFWAFSVGMPPGEEKRAYEEKNVEKVLADMLGRPGSLAPMLPEGATTVLQGHQLFMGRFEKKDLGWVRIFWCCFGEKDATTGDMRDWDAIEAWAREVGVAMKARLAVQQ